MHDVMIPSTPHEIWLPHVFFAKKNHKYPSLDIEETQGLTTDIFDMECAKHTVNQYEPELSMPEAESYDK